MRPDPGTSRIPSAWRPCRSGSPAPSCRCRWVSGTARGRGAAGEWALQATGVAGNRARHEAGNGAAGCTARASTHAHVVLCFRKPCFRKPCFRHSMFQTSDNTKHVVKLPSTTGSAAAAGAALLQQQQQQRRAGWRQVKSCAHASPNRRRQTPTARCRPSCTRHRTQVHPHCMLLQGNRMQFFRVGRRVAA